MSYFNLLYLVFDVDKAKEILSDGRTPVGRVNPLEVADSWLGGVTPRPDDEDGWEDVPGTLDKRWVGLIKIDYDHALSDAVDLTVPLIAVDLGKHGPMIIDGWHRIYRAAVEGVESLPAYMLDYEESMSIIIRGREMIPA